jgi:hypothetical protein
MTTKQSFDGEFVVEVEPDEEEAWEALDYVRFMLMEELLPSPEACDGTLKHTRALCEDTYDLDWAKMGPLILRGVVAANQECDCEVVFNMQHVWTEIRMLLAQQRLTPPSNPNAI